MNVLAVAAHPDDEVLGAGATLARHAAQGDRVDVVFCGQGLLARAGERPESLERLRHSARGAAGRLGAREPRFLDFPDNAMDSVPLLEVVRAVERLFEELQPEVVYTHHPGDLNVDHQITARAVLTAARPLPGARLRALYAWETLSSTEWAPLTIAPPFVPNHFVDASRTLDAKLQALFCYEQELRPFPHPRSAEAVRHLAGLRGSSAGLAAAEAFVTLRSLWP